MPLLVHDIRVCLISINALKSRYYKTSSLLFLSFLHVDEFWSNFSPFLVSSFLPDPKKCRGVLTNNKMFFTIHFFDFNSTFALYLTTHSTSRTDSTAAESILVRNDTQWPLVSTPNKRKAGGCQLLL